MKNKIVVFGKLTFYSIITFSVISYISVMISLLISVGNLEMKPVTNIGFPFKYYYQSWITGSDSPNCGWNINNFIIDFGLTWIIIVIIYLLSFNFRDSRKRS